MDLAYVSWGYGNTNPGFYLTHAGLCISAYKHFGFYIHNFNNRTMQCNANMKLFFSLSLIPWFRKYDIYTGIINEMRLCSKTRFFKNAKVKDRLQNLSTLFGKLLIDLKED